MTSPKAKRFQLDVSLAFKFITRRKKSSAILMVGIAIITMMAVITTITIDSLSNSTIKNDKENNGNWHICYLAEDTQSAQKKLMETGVIDAVSFGCRFNRFPIDGDNCSLDLSLTSDPSMFAIHLIKGRLPKAAREIVVEDWFLRKLGVKRLPVSLVSNGVKYNVTGTFSSNATVFVSVRAYGDYTVNKDLAIPEYLSKTPVGESLPTSQNTGNSAQSTNDKTFVFIRLKWGIPLDKAIKAIENSHTVRDFNGDDILNLTANPMNKTPVYNRDLIGDEKIPAANLFNDSSSNKQLGSSANELQLLLFGALCLLIILSIGVTSGSFLHELGILGAIGMESRRLRRIMLFQTLTLAVVALLTGTLLGILGSCLFYQNVFEDVGTLTLSASHIVRIAAVGFTVTVLTILYVIGRMQSLSPVEAVSRRSGAKGKKLTAAVNVPKLKKHGGKISFPVAFGIKTGLNNSQRTVGFICAIGFLLALFTGMTRDIELSWKTGGARPSYQEDFRIDIPFVDSDSKGNNYLTNIQPPDAAFLSQLKAIPGVSRVYSQDGIVDNDSVEGASLPADSQFYNFFFQLDKSSLTKQGKADLTMNNPLGASVNGYPNSLFIHTAVGGYGDDELNYAKKYLIDGKIDMAQMKAAPVILLPKYITAIRNMNIPYTKLKVGDKITLIENQPVRYQAVGYLKIAKRITVTVGGFLSGLPFHQENGVSTGFVAVMSREQMQKLDGSIKGTMEIYVSENANANILPTLMKLCNARKYKVFDIKDSFASKETQAQAADSRARTYGAFGMLALVMFLCIFDIFISEVSMRKPEFALLSSLGMTRRQISFSVLAESLFFGVFGCLLGLAGGMLYVWNIDSDNFSAHYLTKMQMIPWLNFGAAAAVVIVVCAAASVISSWRCLRRLSVQDCQNAE